MNVGVFGGSFNPIHKGHIKVVLEAIKILKLDKIIVVPVGVPSHRNTLLNGAERVKMCRLAFSSKELFSLADVKDEGFLKKIEVSDIEVLNLETSYTYDTLKKIRAIYPKDDIYEIIGEDSANNFIHWKDYEKILNETKVVVFRRLGDKIMIPDEVSSKMIFLDTPYFEYSSTDIRERLEKGLSIKGMSVTEVEMYIDKNNFYK